MVDDVPVSREHLTYLAQQVKLALQVIRSAIKREQQPAGRLGEAEEILSFVRDRLGDAARFNSLSPSTQPPAKVIKLRRR